MKVFRRLDHGILVVILASLLALWPFLTRPGLPVGTDAELHIFRTAELNHLLRGGAIYPRWAPDFYFGYGYPIFNYYAPLTYYLGSALMVLPAVDAVLAVKLVFCLGLLASGLGMFLLGRRLWGTRPGILAAVAYLYAPYIQYIDPHARGVLAESFSFAIFPWVLWVYTCRSDMESVEARTSIGMSPWQLVLGAGLLAALICTHNLMALVLTAILLAWILWQGLISHRGSLKLMLPPFFLGLGIAAFFWLPVALERDAVQLGNVISDGGHFDFRNHFLSLAELIRSTRILDHGATDPYYSFNMGTAQWVLAILAGLSLIWQPVARRKTGVFFALASALLFFLLLPQSSLIWEYVPWMPFLQFPWRLLGPLAACLALLIGSGLAALERVLPNRWSDWITGAILLTILGLAIPLSYPPEWPEEFGPTDIYAISLRELQGRWLGTTSTGDYVPSSVAVVPKATQQIRESYRNGHPVDRVNRLSMPSDTTVVQDFSKDRPLSWTYHVEGKKPFVFRLLHFYFPGWEAILDGKPVPIEIAKPEGFITVSMPAGSHKLTFSFRDTPARTAAWLLSGFSLVVTLVLATRYKRQAIAMSRRTDNASWIVLVPLVFLLFKIALADPLGWFRIRSTGLEVIGADHAVNYQVGQEIALIAYDWKPVGPGETADLTLYWKALEPVKTNYQVFVHLRDSTGAVVAQSDRLNPGDYPAKLWPLDKYVRDEHRFSLPENLPAGEYQLVVGLWLMAEGERLPVSDSSGTVLGDGVWLESQIIR